MASIHTSQFGFQETSGGPILSAKSTPSTRVPSHRSEPTSRSGAAVAGGAKSEERPVGDVWRRDPRSTEL